MNKKWEKFMLSKYYHKDIGHIQKNGLFSGEWNNRFLVQKKAMKEEIKIIKLRVDRIINSLKIDYYIDMLDKMSKDYFYMKYVLVKLNKNNYDFRWNILKVSERYKKEFVDVELSKELYYHFDYLERLYSFWKDECHYYINFVKELKNKLYDIYNDEETDFLELENQLNKIINIDYKLLKFRKRYILKFIHCLQVESQMFKFLVNKEAKHEVFDNAALSSVFITDGSKNVKNDKKIDISLKDQVTLIEKQFEDKKALLAQKIKYFEKRIDYSNIVVNFFNSISYNIEIFVSFIEYNIMLLKKYNNFEIFIDEIKLRIECIKIQIKVFGNILEFIDRYENY